ncbi:MAG: L-arabinose-binding periplasmic protein precursor [Verrucomicrobiota bacterium]|jgi:L-arabinose transport system substrate-binding protein
MPSCCRLAFLSLALILLPGCAKQDGVNQSVGAPPAPGAVKVKLGFLVKQPEAPWFQLEWKFADLAAKEFGFELVKIGVPDGEKLLAAIDNLAAVGAQGFVVCTPDTRLGPSIVAQARLRGLKVIAVDDRFVGSDGKPMVDVHYLGISARKIGESVGTALYAEMVVRNFPPADTAVCAVTFEELDTAKDRVDGAIAALVAAGFAREKIFKAPQKTIDIPAAFDAMNVLLTQHPEAKHWLICGINDSAVLGAVRAAEGRGFSAETVIGIGINGTDCIAEFEKARPTGFFASSLLSARQHGYETAKMLYLWVKEGREPPLETRTVGVLINRENFARMLKEQGIH